MKHVQKKLDSRMHRQSTQTRQPSTKQPNNQACVGHWIRRTQKVVYSSNNGNMGTFAAAPAAAPAVAMTIAIAIAIAIALEYVVNHQAPTNQATNQN